MDLVIANKGASSAGYRLARDITTQQTIPRDQCPISGVNSQGGYHPAKQVGSALPFQRPTPDVTYVLDVDPQVVLLPSEDDRMSDFVRTFQVDFKPQLSGYQRKKRQRRWNRSKQNGDVVLNPDERMRATVSIISTKGSSVKAHTIRPITRIHEVCGKHMGVLAMSHVSPSLLSPGGVTTLDGVPYARAEPTAATLYTAAAPLNSSYGQAWAEEQVRELMVELKRANKVNTRLTTQVVASMNQKAFDLSTFFGEIPETMMMITNASKDSLRMAQEASSKVEVLKKNSLKETELIDIRIKNARKRGHKIKMDELYAKKARNSFQLAEAIANVWLSYRFGIAPLAQSIDTMMDALDASVSFYQTERQGERVNPSINFRGRSHTIEVIHRCFLRRRHGAKTLRIAQAMRKDWLFTAWELAPLSVIIDYFWNIGNVISACGYPTHEFRDFGQYSWKSTGEVSWFTNDAMVTINFEHYRCFPTTLLEYIELHWDPLLTIKRQMDLVAISWHAFKGTSPVIR